MAVSGTGSIIYIDNGNDGSSKVNAEVYRNILSATWQRNAFKIIGGIFIVQQDNDPKHIATTVKHFMKG